MSLVAGTMGLEGGLKSIRAIVFLGLKGSHASIGGVEQFIQGLVEGLTHINDNTLEIVFVGYEQDRSWLNRLVAEEGTLAILPDGQLKESAMAKVGGKDRRFSRLIYSLKDVTLDFVPGFLRTRLYPWTTTDRAIGLQLDELRPQVVHFPFQYVVPVKAPIVWDPHDLQHVHHPRFFSARERWRRRWQYSLYAGTSTKVVASSEWCQSDFVANLRIPAEKVEVIITGPGIADVSATSKEVLEARYQLTSDEFFFYPARTWRHKNHIGLLHAMAMLRDESQIETHLLCTGEHADGWDDIDERVKSLGLENHVRFLGRVPEEDVVGLYRMARFVAIPTLFESSSLPMLEAFRLGVPVTAASVTSLPEQGKGAAVFFDPTNISDIARALRTMWCDSKVREEMAREGKRRSELFDWKQAALTYASIYKELAESGE